MDSVTNLHIVRVAEYLKEHLDARVKVLHGQYGNQQTARELNWKISQATEQDYLAFALGQFIEWATKNDWVTDDVESDDGEEVDEHRWAERNADIGDMYEEARK